MNMRSASYVIEFFFLFGHYPSADLLCGLSKWHAYKRGTERLGIHLHSRAPQIVIGPHLHVWRLQPSNTQ
jgi:hypothetical protein